ncbi:uncharacterized protein LOC107045603 isoform X2 [Diachasma alloeum]|nr:uncharacterized protein LOC107045603 isoform X2 [Diachasma alloeum]
MTVYAFAPSIFGNTQIRRHGQSTRCVTSQFLRLEIRLNLLNFSFCVNHKTIGRLKFGALQEALEHHSRLWKVKCSEKKCPGSCTVDIILNFHIYIELDIRPNVRAEVSLRCKLRDFPIHLNLGGMPYRLAGVIERIPGHYLAYT